MRARALRVSCACLRRFAEALGRVHTGENCLACAVRGLAEMPIKIWVGPRRAKLAKTKSAARNQWLIHEPQISEARSCDQLALETRGQSWSYGDFCTGWATATASMFGGCPARLTSCSQGEKSLYLSMDATGMDTGARRAGFPNRRWTTGRRKSRPIGRETQGTSLRFKMKAGVY